MALRPIRVLSVCAGVGGMDRGRGDMRYLSLCSGIEAASVAWAGVPMAATRAEEIRP